MTDVTREDVLREIRSARYRLAESANEDRHDPEERLIRATQAIAEAQIATAYALLAQAAPEEVPDR